MRWKRFLPLLVALLLALWALERAFAPRPVVVFAGVELHASPRELQLAPGGKTLTMLRPHQPLHLRLVSGEPLASATLDMSENAPSQLRVEGGEVGLRLFRPDGTLLYQLLLDTPVQQRRWGIGAKKLRYDLVLTLVGAAPETPVDLTLTVERVAPAPPPPSSTEPRT